MVSPNSLDPTSSGHVSILTRVRRKLSGAKREDEKAANVAHINPGVVDDRSQQPALDVNQRVLVALDNRIEPDSTNQLIRESSLVAVKLSQDHPLPHPITPIGSPSIWPDGIPYETPDISMDQPYIRRPMVHDFGTRKQAQISRELELASLATPSAQSAPSRLQRSALVAVQDWDDGFEDIFPRDDKQIPQSDIDGTSAEITRAVWTLQDSSSFDAIDIPRLRDLTGFARRDTTGIRWEGGHGDVFRGTLKNYNGAVAIKVLRNKMSIQDGLDQVKRHLCREIAVWHALRHPNIVELIGISRDFGHLPAMISPWFPQGNALAYLRRNPDANRLNLIYGVASAVDYMHRQTPPVTHGDLKAENVLISNHGEPMLCDFGVAKVARVAEMSSGFTTTKVIGTLVFMAAELHEEPIWTTATDIYAFGGLCLQLVCGVPPFYKQKGNVILAISRGQKPMRPESFTHNQLWELLSQCWELDPESRPVMPDILKQLRRFAVLS